MTTKTDEILIDFRIKRSGSPSETRMMALDWIRSNKEEMIDIIAKMKSFEFVAKNGGTPDEILWARINVVNYLASLARDIELQISAEASCSPLEYWRNQNQSAEHLGLPHLTNVMQENKPEVEEFSETVNQPIKAPSYGDLSGF
jgi:hypothetical protein